MGPGGRTMKKYMIVLLEAEKEPGKTKEGDQN